MVYCPSAAQGPLASCACRGSRALGTSTNGGNNNNNNKMINRCYMTAYTKQVGGGWVGVPAEDVGDVRKGGRRDGLEGQGLAVIPNAVSSFSVITSHS